VASVIGNSVTVCLNGTRSVITCGEPGTQDDPAAAALGGMVRQNESTNEVDKLANYCPPLADDAGVGSPGDTCYVDECVPPGTYLYGLATPYDCSQAGCGSVGLFAEAIVSTPLPPDCQRSSGNAAPTETSMPAPWGSGEDPSPWRSCPGGCECRSSTDFRILGGDVATAVVGAGVWLAMRRRRRRT
jgi:hypothetical protein